MPAARWVLGLGLALGIATGAVAHHPGSHAAKQRDGRVRLEVVATVTDTCTSIAQVRIGLPPGVAAAPSGTPVTARLRRQEGPCEEAPTAIRGIEALELDASVGQLHLYVIAPDGSLASTERIPVR